MNMTSAAEKRSHAVSPALTADGGAGADAAAAAGTATSAAIAGRAAPAARKKAIRQSALAETLLECPVIFPVLSDAAAAWGIRVVVASGGAIKHSPCQAGTRRAASRSIAG